MGLATMSGPIRSLGGVYITGPGAVVNVTTSTLVLNPTLHAGRLIRLNVATTTITLPALNSSVDDSQDSLNNFGVEYNFVVETSATAQKIITTGGNLLIGGVWVARTAATLATDKAFFLAGASDISLNLDNSTKGGTAGSAFSIQAVSMSGAASTGKWLVKGVLATAATSTVVTPFAAS